MGKTNQPTRPASSSERPDFTSGCVYARVVVAGESLRRTDGARLLVLVAVERPLPVIDVDCYQAGDLLDVVA